MPMSAEGHTGATKRPVQDEPSVRTSPVKAVTVPDGALGKSVDSGPLEPSGFRLTNGRSVNVLLGKSASRNSEIRRRPTYAVPENVGRTKRGHLSRTAAIVTPTSS